jgi:potassium voltage-gated channel Eag-related subfamily H protein 8
MTKIWQRVKKMMGKQSTRLPCVAVDGNIVVEPRVVADVLARSFADVSSGRHCSPAFLASKGIIEQQHLDFNTNLQYPYNDHITMTELYNALRHSNNSSPGPDGIHYKMLRKMHSTAIRVLLSIYNKIWTTHYYPQSWRTATVLAFHKPGKPAADVTSYRPIALTSCVG